MVMSVTSGALQAVHLEIAANTSIIAHPKDWTVKLGRRLSTKTNGMILKQNVIVIII